MNVSLFRLLGTSDQNRVHQVLTDIVDEWRGTWFAKPLNVELAVFEPSANFSNEGKWLFFGETSEAWLAWQSDSALTTQFLELMFDSFVSVSAKPSPLMESLMSDCMLDLLAKISQQVVGNDIYMQSYNVAPSSLRCGYGSGVLGVVFQGSLPAQRIVFGGAVIEALLSNETGISTFPRDSLSDRASMLGNYTTRLEVVVGKAEISIEDLAEIEVGDVVPLSGLVKDYFQVRSVENGKVLAKAHLGLLNERKAIQFIE